MMIGVLGSVAAVALAAISVLFGFSVRHLLLKIGDRYLTAFDFFFGYGLASLIALLVYRSTGHLMLGAGAASLVAVVAIAPLAIGDRFSIRLPDKLALVIGGTFVVAVAAVYIPMMIGGGLSYAPPPVYDAPKHLLTLTALAESPSWPPVNPLYGSAAYTYNFLFYILPAALTKAAGVPELSFVLFPWMLIVTTGAVVWLSVEMSALLDLPRHAQWITALFATWIGGLTPLLVTGYPPLGYLLAMEHWSSFNIWADEPFISAIFVPQHAFAAAAIMALIWIFAQTGAFAARMTCAALLMAAASLCSFILLPHAAVAFAGVALIFALKEGLARSLPVALYGGAVYAALIAMPLVEAIGWHGAGDGQPFAALPPLDSTWLAVAAALGPALPFGVLGITIVLLQNRRGPIGWSWASLMLLAAAAAMTLRYSEVSFKSTLLLRIMLAPVASVGCVWLYRRSGNAARAALIAGCVAVAALNIPTVAIHMKYSWRELGASDSAVIEALRRSPSPILLDGADQWVAALTARPVVMDFRLYRDDAYLPADQRDRHAAYFDSLATSDEAHLISIAREFGTIAAAPDRAARWEAILGPPVAHGFGVSIFTHQLPR